MIPRPSFSRLPVIVWVFPLAVYEVHGLKGSTNGSSLLRFFAARTLEDVARWSDSIFFEISRKGCKQLQVLGIKFWARRLYHILTMDISDYLAVGENGSVVTVQGSLTNEIIGVERVNVGGEIGIF